MTLHLVATGGTIASLADPSSGAVRPAVAATELVAGVPGLDRWGPVTVEEVTRVASWNLTPPVMAEVARRAAAALAREEVRGVIVTHGTDTAEETAFLLDVTVASGRPVVVTAAMRSGDEVGADGPRNLLAAATVAAAPDAAGLGAVVVLNDEVHAARWVRKQDAFRVSAFRSPDHGPLGHVHPPELRLRSRPGPRWHVALPAELDAPVPLVRAYTGMEEGLVEAVLDATGARGLVLEGSGCGNLPGGATRGVRAALDRGLPVVLATSVPSGGTLPVYGGPGGGATLRDLGVTGAGTLPATKARLLMMLLLAGGTPSDQALAHFREAVEVLA